MNQNTEAQVLEVLGLGWDDVYEVGVGLDGFWARRRDGLGETIVDEDPGEVRRRLQEEHTGPPRRD